MSTVSLPTSNDDTPEYDINDMEHGPLSWEAMKDRQREQEVCDQAAERESEADYTVWQLARMAGVADPDSWDSAGAKFLVHIETGFVDAEGLDDDDVHEIADSYVPVYTHDIWQTFVDLAAYGEDVSEWGAFGDDLTRVAAVALYMIAERLLAALRDAT